MKLLRKVKKRWVAVSIGTAAIVTVSAMPAFAANDAVVEQNTLNTESVAENTDNVIQSDTSMVANTEEMSETNMPATDSTTIDTRESSREEVETNEIVDTEIASGKNVNDNSVVETSTTTDTTELSAHNTVDEKALQIAATPVISSENASTKITNAITVDNRTVISQPTSSYKYSVKYDTVNQLYYVDAIDFGLNVQDGKDDTEAINRALATANAVIMTDESGNQYQGVGVKLTGIVNVARSQGELDYYQLRSYSTDGQAELVSGATIAGVANTQQITADEYATLVVDSDGLVKYINAKGTETTGILVPIYKQVGAFNQIKIDDKLPYVTALFGDGTGSTTVKTNLVQLGDPWNPGDNDTDSRKHAVILVENIDGFLIKDLSVNILSLTEAFGTKADGFYVKGAPYYGKVNGIQVDDSDNVSVDTVEISGANKAGVFFTSSYNTVSQQLDPTTTVGKNYGNKKRSLNYLVQAAAINPNVTVKENGTAYSFDDFNIGINNKILKSNLHNNRVAGIQFAFQKQFLADGNTVAENGHSLSGSTGYGIASSAGSYNDYYIYRNNTSLYNYRKGYDAHEGDHILIEKNISYGDRLLGISVYNRSYEMANVIIRNNLVVQDTNNRLAKNDLTLDGSFSSGSDYAAYNAIFLQTNEKFRDLSADGKIGYFEISGNTIQGLDNSGQMQIIYESTGKTGYKDYVSDAIFVRMGEPYLDYILKIDNNTITGISASSVIAVINSANDNFNNNGTQTDTTKFANGLGYGSGAISITNNKVNIDTVSGRSDKEISPIYVAEDNINTRIRTSEGVAYQDKFRGSVVIEDNEFIFQNTKLSSGSKTVPAVNVTTNAEGVVVNNNVFDFGNVTQSSVTNLASSKPLIFLQGITGPTVQESSYNMDSNAGGVFANWPSSLRYTQPLVFTNNDISIDDISYKTATTEVPLRVLTSEALIRYIDNNNFTSKSSVIVNAVKEESDANGNTVYDTMTTSSATPSDNLNSRTYNLATERFNGEAPILVSSVTEVLNRDTIYVVDSSLKAGEEVVDVEGQDGEKVVNTYKITINNSKYDAVGDINVDNPLPGLVRNHFSLQHLTSVNDNNRIAGLIRGSYVVTTGDSTGESLTVTKTYDYTTSKNTAASTTVTYTYLDMPVKLEDGTEYSFTETVVLTSAVARVIRVGVNNTTDIGIVETEEIPFETVYIETDQLAKGMTQVQVAGSNGIRTLIYKQTEDVSDGSALTAKTLISSTVTTDAVTQYVLVGTHEEPSTRTVQKTVTAPIAYRIVYVNSTELPVGIQQVQTKGQEGVMGYVYQYILDADGKVISYILLANTVITEPIDEVVFVGTAVNKEAQQSEVVVQTDTADKQMLYKSNITEQATLPATGESTDNSILLTVLGVFGLLSSAWIVGSKKKKED